MRGHKIKQKSIYKI